MPFYLYRLDGDSYVRARKEVPLAGRNGPLFAAARSSPETPEWEISEDGLLRHFGVDPTNHAFIVDLKPKVTDRVSLYRLKHVWGYSDNGWTPFALELEALYVDKVPPEGTLVEEVKAQFPKSTEPGERIYEFLYVNGDGRGGSWAFGRVGSVNAPLLWEGVFDSFIKRINRKRRDIDVLKPLG